MQHVFIIGSKGIPARYGGFETFVDKLTEGSKNENIKYHVACMSKEDSGTFEYNGAECFNIIVPEIGPAKAILYDVYAFKWCLETIKSQNIQHPIVYVLACRIGPFIGGLKRKLHRLGGKLLVNPDGHEFLRAKWSAPVRKYWKISESLMVKHADMLICDSLSIEQYIRKDYEKYNPNTRFIAYGTDISERDSDPDAAEQKKYNEWCKKYGLEPKEYYLVVGRFVPENNYETMLSEFMKSSTSKKFVLITNIEQNEFCENLKKKTGFESDTRIIFPGTVYDQELLKNIRNMAYGYFHGHEVGGTNPSLLEALGSTKLNLLLGVNFNKEVAQEGAVYWTKEKGNLSSLINEADGYSEEFIEKLGETARMRMKNNYSWESIVNKYEQVFLNLY